MIVLIYLSFVMFTKFPELFLPGADGYGGRFPYLVIIPKYGLCRAKSLASSARGGITWLDATKISGNFGKVSKKLVYLLRWTTFPGRTGLNFV